MASCLCLFTLLLLFVGICTCQEGVCDKPRNSPLPFCDSSLPIDTRVQDLIGRLTLNEKISLLDHSADATSTNVDLDEYTWWNEALHGVARSPGVTFRAPTPFATSFPQVINLASAFDKGLFFRVGNVTGNEARAFYNAGNSGLTWWAPNTNIFRDPRWGRGHETPGEDPHLSSEFSKAYIRGMQGDGDGSPESGFIKASACCKHFAAHSQEEDRFSFNSIVNEQDMADTYLPAFKSCVEGGVSCIMCAYNAINGVPSCASKDLLTDTLREKWGFDGYVTTDCGGVETMWLQLNYTHTEAETCAAILDAGVDIECHWESDLSGIFSYSLAPAIDEGKVTVQMIDTALARATRVQMRLGHFEKEATRPFKDLTPDIVDTEAHRTLALQAARQSIVLLKNAQSLRTGQATLPLDQNSFRRAKPRAKRASMGLIGPHGIGGTMWLGNYHGVPPFIKEPVEEIQKYVPDAEYEKGCEITGSDDSLLQAAVDLARDSSQVVIFVGLHAEIIERESRDRDNLTLPGLQDELIRRVLAVVDEPVILFVVSGGGMDVSEWHNHPKVGAIIWAGYLGQAAGEAIADVMFGVYNPSGRLAQTFYATEFLSQVDKADMRMRPGSGTPGRTYRFYTGQPLYPFGYGLSYTSFTYAFEDGRGAAAVQYSTHADCAITVNVTVRNTGQRAGDHSVLWYIAPPNAGQGGRPIKTLLDFEFLDNIFPLQTRVVTICLSRDDFQLANDDGEFQVVPGEWKLTVGSLERTILVV